jgi:hypothetical protein
MPEFYPPAQGIGVLGLPLPPDGKNFGHAIEHIVVAAPSASRSSAGCWGRWCCSQHGSRPARPRPEPARRAIDMLTATKAIDEMIVVAPNGRNAYLFCYFVDLPGSGTRRYASSRQQRDACA